MDVMPVPSAPVPKISPARRRVRASRLKAARAARGLTQEQMARELDVRVGTISDRENSGDAVETGEGVPWETWLAWAMALGLSVDWKPGAPVPADGWAPRNPAPTPTFDD